MYSGIAFHPEEGILPLDSHAEARISRQEPARNEIKATLEKHRHQGQELPNYPILKVVPFLICFSVVVLRAERIVKDEIVKPQAVPELFGAHRSTDDFPVRVIQQAGNLAFRAQLIFNGVLLASAGEGLEVSYPAHPVVIGACHSVRGNGNYM